MKHYRFLIFGTILFLGVFMGCAQQKEKSLSETNEQKINYNRLINASSPYLQEHADNPVDWYEWGPEALQKAKDENKLLIISIGYAACHWCHVMERETYMDSSAAKIMNDNFVSIKIDREERPDLDQVYMDAAQLLNGSGGWPLNVVALPNGKPFFAGTYFPTAQWKDILTQIDRVHKNNPEKIETAATELTQGIREQGLVNVSRESAIPISKESYIGLFSEWEKTVDFKKGGFNHAPKFPLPVGWQFLLQNYYLTGNPKALEAVEATLDNMAQGGIYDQLGGGFSRYSTDSNWFAPHFEKMLYDNAQLVSLYSNAYKVTKKEEYKNVVEKTLNFINKELADPNGGYYSSLNADSEGEEGKFYVWGSKEIKNALTPAQAGLIEDYYGIKNNGNWEKGQNILHRKYSEKQYAKIKDLNLSDFKKELAEIQNKLLEVRNKRIHPSTDDKVLTSWNALMITAYLDAYTAWGDDKYLQKALENAKFMENHLRKPDGGLWRNYKDGKASINAFLDDYAFLAEAYFHLYEVTFEKKWLEKSKSLTDYAIAHFQDKKTGFFFYTSDLGEDLIARKKEIPDNVMPSSNSVMATMLYKLGSYFENEDYLKESEKMVLQVQEDIKNGGPYYANWGMLMGTISFSPFEIAIMGENSLKKNLELQKNYLPTSFFMGGQTEDLPLLEEKLVKGETIIYVCKNKTCKLPVYETDKALQLTKEYQSENTGSSI